LRIRYLMKISLKYSLISAYKFKVIADTKKTVICNKKCNTFNYMYNVVMYT